MTTISGIMAASLNMYYEKSVVLLAIAAEDVWVFIRAHR